jgi:hypothetical protein
LFAAPPTLAIDAADADRPAASVAEESPPPDDFGPPHRGRDGFQRGPRAGAMLWRRMTEEERTGLREFIAEEYPEMYDRLLEAQADDPEGFEPGIGRILPEMIRMKELRDRDPELFQVRKTEQQVEFELRRLARRYRFASTDEDRAVLAEKIRPLVEQQFDIRQRRMEEEVSRLEKRLEQLRQRIARQAAARDAEIQKMYERILEGGPGGFGPPGEGHPGEGPPRHERFRRGSRPTGQQPQGDTHAVPEPGNE